MLGIVPGMRVAAPRDAARLREELGEALDVKDGPTAIRFPKGDVGEDIPAVERRDGCRRARRPRRRAVRRTCCWWRSVRSPRWRCRWPSGCATRASASRSSTRAGCFRCPRCLVRSRRRTSWSSPSEDHGVHGGIGSSVSAALRRNEIDVPCRDVGVPQEFQDACVAQRGAHRGGPDRPEHRPSDHRLGGRARQLGRRVRGQRPGRLARDA